MEKYNQNRNTNSSQQRYIKEAMEMANRSTNRSVPKAAPAPQNKAVPPEQNVNNCKTDTAESSCDGGSNNSTNNDTVTSNPFNKNATGRNPKTYSTSPPPNFNNFVTQHNCNYDCNNFKKK